MRRPMLILTPVSLIPYGHGGVAGVVAGVVAEAGVVAGVVAEAVGAAGVGLHPTGTPGGRTAN